MDGVPWVLALASGVLAALNPCGFAMLPVYLSVLAATDEPSRRMAVLRALAGAGATAVGFAAVFGTFGLVLSSVGNAVQRQLPWATIAAGLVAVALGGWLVAGRDLPGVTVWAGRAPRVRRSAWSMVVFGAVYALVSLGCAIAPFLATVAFAFRAGSTVVGIGLFVTYALGMALVVATAASLVALARHATVRRMRSLAPVVARLGGVVVIVAGAYVAYYGWYELRVFRGGAVSDPVIAAATSVQARLADVVERFGVAGLALALVGVLAAAVLVARPGRRG